MVKKINRDIKESVGKSIAKSSKTLWYNISRKIGKGRIVLELKQRIQELELRVGGGANVKET